jgi:hypothetical protein
MRKGTSGIVNINLRSLCEPRITPYHTIPVLRLVLPKSLTSAALQSAPILLVASRICVSPMSATLRADSKARAPFQHRCCQKKISITSSILADSQNRQFHRGHRPSFNALVWALLSATYHSTSETHQIQTSTVTNSFDPQLLVLLALTPTHLSILVGE